MVEIIDTYAEAFEGTVTQLLVTAKNEALLKQAVYSFTALPSTVFGDAEGGLVRWVDTKKTPDGRPGAVVQLWVLGYGKKPIATLEDRLGRRTRQGILVVPTTAVFNDLKTKNQFDMMKTVGHCGDGYEWIIDYKDRRMINVPIMMGHDFLIEHNLGYREGVMGGNIWMFCESVEAALEAGEKGVEAILKVDGAITSFNICSAGSKPETNFPEIGPSTNHWFCPTLKDKIEGSKVPSGIKSIPEIVIDGLDMETVKRAMKAAIDAILDVPGLRSISAGNYGGKLGKYKIYLKDLSS
ncbi:MAG: formylmethanofuran--tetrahydromethanopterin N-formyltransferase [Candidatus Helarchaeota archaeon]|nr:formylmethanofuran--tetrahydromethanopterin N-formyltransferase [Candidatus Helarchaeota archaeon]